MLDPALQSGPFDVDDQAGAVVQVTARGCGRPSRRTPRSGSACRPGPPNRFSATAAKVSYGPARSLGADVDPAPRSSARTGQARFSSRGTPARRQFRPGWNWPGSPRRPSCVASPDWPARLDQHGLVRRQVVTSAPGVEDRHRGRPGRAAVDDEVVGGSAFSGSRVSSHRSGASALHCGPGACYPAGHDRSGSFHGHLSSFSFIAAPGHVSTAARYSAGVSCTQASISGASHGPPGSRPSAGPQRRDHRR